MARRPLLSPIPADVNETTPLTRPVAQAIYSSLAPRQSELYFTEALVSIAVSYASDPRQTTGSIVVSPDKVTIQHTVDPFRAEVNELPKARQVRWVVQGLAENDTLMIRPKPGSPEYLFNYLGGSVFEIAAPDNSITSGLPFIPQFEPMATEKNVIVWRYNVEVWRNGEKIFDVDPEVHVEGEYNTGP